MKVRPVFDLIRQYLDDNMTPAQVSKLTWAPEKAIVSLARDMAASGGKTLIACGMGPNQFWNNDNKDRALFLILALAGSLGRHGGNIGSYAGTYKNTLFAGVASRYVQEDPFHPQLDPDGPVTPHVYYRPESMHYWANGERIMKAGTKTITTGAHVPTPTKAIWQVNSNSSLGATADRAAPDHVACDAGHHAGRHLHLSAGAERVTAVSIRLPAYPGRPTPLDLRTERA